MAILKVARMGHPVLRTTAQPVPRGDIASNRIQRLIDDMFDTMSDQEGIGLAAPQVHESLRIFVAGLTDADVVTPMDDDRDMPYIALINPEVSVVDPTVSVGWEGCLSIPDIRGKVPRPVSVQVRALDRKGRRIEIVASGLPARVIQHENDHLDGVLFFDRMGTFETLTFLDEFRKHWTRRDEDGDDAEVDA